MTSDSISKQPAMPAYLSEQMTVSSMVTALEHLQFNKRRDEARLIVDPGVATFLVRATKAAAADPDAKIRHAWRSIKEPLR